MKNVLKVRHGFKIDEGVEITGFSTNIDVSGGNMVLPTVEAVVDLVNPVSAQSESVYSTVQANSALWNSGGFNLIVEDQDVQVLSGVNKIDFVGSGVNVRNTGAGKVSVYIPRYQAVSNFNTFDGVGDCRVSDASSTNRYIADPTSEGTPFNVGTWYADGLQHSCFNSSISYSTVNSCMFFNNTSTSIEVTVFDADGVTPIASKILVVTGNINSTSGGINIQVSSFSVDGPVFKGIVTVNLALATILPNSGKFSVSIVHHNGSNNYTKTQNNLFYDSQPLTASLINVSISENAITLKKLSGVSMYYLGSTFNVGIAQIDNLNADSFPSVFVKVIGPNYALPELNLIGSNLGSWDRLWNNSGATFSKINWTISTANSFLRSNTAKIQAATVDWSQSAYSNSPNSSIVLDTYSDTSTRILEDFDSETNRLMSDYTTPWDSAQSLIGYDATPGLQAGEGGKLLYPTVNYTLYKPNTGAQYDYSGASSRRYYFRKMWHTNVSHFNGKFNILGILQSDIVSGGIKIEISLDGLAWYDCGADYLGGVLHDGDGCRINTETEPLPQLEFTFGGNYTSATTNWAMMLRISMPYGSTAQLDRIEITNWI